MLSVKQEVSITCLFLWYDFTLNLTPICLFACLSVSLSLCFSLSQYIYYIYIYIYIHVMKVTNRIEITVYFIFYPGLLICIWALLCKKFLYWSINLSINLEREREIETETERETQRERECVCVCVFSMRVYFLDHYFSEWFRFSIVAYSK